MKKILNIILTAIASSTPVFAVQACFFEIKKDIAIKSIMNNIANQSSNILKAMVISKEQKTENALTISDIISKITNPTIEDNSARQKFSFGSDFERYWGVNNKIKTSNFNLDDFITKPENATTTREKAKLEKQNITFGKLSNGAIISQINNSLLSSIYLNNKDVRKTVINILTNFKKKKDGDVDKNYQPYVRLIKNSIIGPNWEQKSTQSHLTENFINPLKLLLTNINDNSWDLNGQKTPDTANKGEALKSFMQSWKDDQNNYYSQWTIKKGFLKKEIVWDLGLGDYQNWNQNDYNFYRAGAILNHLILKIGQDYQITPSGANKYKDRYLGDIMRDHFNFTALAFDQKGFLNDLSQYWPKIMLNPHYLIDIAQALVPFLKIFVLNFSDTKSNLENITFGANKSENQSINIADIFGNLVKLLKNHDLLKSILENILAGNKKSNYVRSFLFDVRIPVPVLGSYPLPNILNGPLVKKEVLENLVKEFGGWLNSDSFKAITMTITKIGDYANLFNNALVQSKNTINFKINTLIDFLFGNKILQIPGILAIFDKTVVKKEDENGLLSLFNSDKKSKISEEQYQDFYINFGGKISKTQRLNNKGFQKDSVIDLFLTNINSPGSFTHSLSQLLFGNVDRNITGVFNILIKKNNDWIENNYFQYFDSDNQKLANVNLISYNLDGKETNSGKMRYQLNYQINNKIYQFIVNGQFEPDISTGSIKFHFAEIDLIKTI